MSNKILITGVSGMIGSALALRAKEKGYKVIGTSRKEHFKISKILGIDILNLNLDDRLPNLPEVDYVIHCATPNDTQSKDFQISMKLALEGTKKIIENYSQSKLKKFIFISTAQIYGQTLLGDYSEDSLPKCENFYALNHFFGEELCRMYSHQEKHKFTIIRPTNVYGVPNIFTVKRENLVPTCFVISLIKEGKINMRSSGLQMRDFIHHDLLSDIILNQLVLDKGHFDIVNATSGNLISIKRIAELCLKKYQKLFYKKAIINFLSDKPKKINKFNFNKKNSDFLKNEIYYEKIEETIEKLFILYKNNV